MIKKPLTEEDKQSAIDLRSFKGAIYNSEAEYTAAYKDKIFRYGKQFYKYRFKFGIKTRYIGENLIVMGLIIVKGDSPDINNFHTEVCFPKNKFNFIVVLQQISTGQ